MGRVETREKEGGGGGGKGEERELEIVRGREKRGRTSNGVIVWSCSTTIILKSGNNGQFTQLTFLTWRRSK